MNIVEIRVLLCSEEGLVRAQTLEMLKKNLCSLIDLQSFPPPENYPGAYILKGDSFQIDMYNKHLIAIEGSPDKIILVLWVFDLVIERDLSYYLAADGIPEFTEEKKYPRTANLEGIGRFLNLLFSDDYYINIGKNLAIDVRAKRNS